MSRLLLVRLSSLITLIAVILIQIQCTQPVPEEKGTQCSVDFSLSDIINSTEFNRARACPVVRHALGCGWVWPVTMRSPRRNVYRAHVCLCVIQCFSYIYIYIYVQSSIKGMYSCMHVCKYVLTEIADSRIWFSFHPVELQRRSHFIKL